MKLKPSNIFYSQNCINNIFRRRCPHGTIGDTLDDLYYGRTSISNIPKIAVVKKDGKWFTLDNRRLWIFHHLEGAGKLDTIHVNVETEISSRKYTTNNGGVSVKIYLGRDPGGKCRKRITPVRPRVPESDILDSPECSDETAIKPVEDLPSIIPNTNISAGNDIVPSTLESSDTHDIQAEPAIDENGTTHKVLTPDSQTEQNTENEIKAVQASNEEECEQHAESQETAKKPVVDLPAVILDTNISVGNDIVPSTHESSDKHHIKAEPAIDENGLSILGNTHEVLKPDIKTEESTEFKRQSIQASNEEECEQQADSRETVKMHIEDPPAVISNKNISVGNNTVPSTNESSDKHDIKAEPAIDVNGLSILGNTHEVLTPDSQTKEITEFEIKAIQASNEEECELHADSQKTVTKPVEDLPAIIPNTNISVGNDIVPSTHESFDMHDKKAEPSFEENCLSILVNTHEVLKPDIQTEENTEFKVKSSQASNEEKYEQHAVYGETDSPSLKSPVCGSTENGGFDNSDKGGDVSESINDNVICNGIRGNKRSVSSLCENEDGAAEGKRVKLD